MNQEIRTKGDDGELSSLIVVNGIFTLALLLIDIFYKNIGSLLSSWLLVPFLILHIGVVVGWVVVIAKRNDPNFDVMRKALLFVLIGALLLLLAHRAGWVSDKMMQEEVDKNKQEQR